MNQLLIVWHRGRDSRDRILSAIGERHTVRRVTEVEWSSARADENFGRLHGKSATTYLDMSRHVGAGPFSAIVFETNAGDAEGGTASETASHLPGPLSGFDFTRCTATPSEFTRDVSLLFGIGDSRLNLDASTKWDGQIDRYAADLVGANGWADFREMFQMLNSCSEYVVLRNVRDLNRWPDVDKDFDIDVLCRDREVFAANANARKISWKDYKIGYNVIVSGIQVRIDIREVGDRYYSERWQETILKNRQFEHEYIFAPSQEDHFYSLLYHAVLHKKTFPEKYVEVISKDAPRFGISQFGASNNWFREQQTLASVISDILLDRGYRCTFPKDLANGLRPDIVPLLDRRIRPSSLRYHLSKPFLKLAARIGAQIARSRFLRQRTAALSVRRRQDWSPGLNPCSWLEGTVCSSITISPKRERVSEGLELVFQEPFELARNRAETGHDNQPMWPVSINGRPCHVVRVQSSPLHVAGIFPAQNLRSKEGLREGDFVRLAIPSDCVERLSMLRKFAWVLLWRFRERLFYKSRRYPKIISRLGSLARASEQA